METRSPKKSIHFKFNLRPCYFMNKQNTTVIQWNLSWETTAMRNHLSWNTISFWQKALHFSVNEPVTKDHLSSEPIFLWPMGWSFMAGFTVFCFKVKTTTELRPFSPWLWVMWIVGFPLHKEVLPVGLYIRVVYHNRFQMESTVSKVTESEHLLILLIRSSTTKVLHGTRLWYHIHRLPFSDSCDPAKKNWQPHCTGIIYIRTTWMIHYDHISG